MFIIVQAAQRDPCLNQSVIIVRMGKHMGNGTLLLRPLEHETVLNETHRFSLIHVDFGFWEVLLRLYKFLTIETQTKGGLSL